MYGPCISTATWAEWSRHRKVLAPAFNEKIMSFAWGESIRQTHQLLEAWTGQQVENVAKDTRSLSLNVLAATGFRKSYPFQSANVKDPHANDTDESSDYRDALQTELNDSILLMIMPRKLLSL